MCGCLSNITRPDVQAFACTAMVIDNTTSWPAQCCFAAVAGTLPSSPKWDKQNLHNRQDGSARIVAFFFTF